MITDLLRLTFPFLLFVSLTALAAGALNSFQRFGWPAFTLIILNLCMIAGALWGSKFTTPPIMAMGWAILAAGVLQTVVSVAAIGAIGFVGTAALGLASPGYSPGGDLDGAHAVGLSVAQVNLLFDHIHRGDAGARLAELAIHRRPLSGVSAGGSALHWAR